jgi:hypothetical protein
MIKLGLRRWGFSDEEIEVAVYLSSMAIGKYLDDTKG